MFSYRHAFHAGNHADVLKHTTLIALMKYLTQKDTALTVIDTHAGAGLPGRMLAICNTIPTAAALRPSGRLDGSRVSMPNDSPYIAPARSRS